MLACWVTCSCPPSCLLVPTRPAGSYSTCLGPLNLPANASVHPSLFAIGSRAKVFNQIGLSKEQSNQIVLVVYSLSQLVDFKAEVCLTALI
ncbi:hypothetical protein L3X38_031950 [Prunus dulcis]|uniref:Uncharacterized protein n=1 Tax=Prunus dulcis TaxID=3755 RepID=A0AAD4VDI0_PRUDU|nr:hypothetical protein L3X38_031950 [Prunus dulcis]